MNRIVSSMLCSMIALSALSQVKGDKPTLVVGIIIDQLRSDYIELLQAHFGEHGFNKLINDGAYFENVDFALDQTNATSGSAIVFTGSYPNVNGIPGTKVFDSKTKYTRDILTDATQMGNFTNEKLSPKALPVSTLGDEVRMNSGGLGYVYAIAPDAQQAIILGGHAANSAVWISDITGNWASTVFYKDFPSFLQMRNYGNSIASRLDTATWKPSLKLDSYPDIPTYRKFYPFRYSYSRNDKNRFSNYKQSALVNEEVTDVAIDHLKTLSLGKRGQLDMLNIAYTVAPYDNSIDRDFRIELQDSYIKLDAQLARLFNAIDNSVGKDHAVIFVSSTGYFTDNRLDEAKYNIPSGEFHVLRAKSLLNMYLMAIYGNGEWVSGYHERNIYLNRDLIKQRNVNLEEIRTKSAHFVRQMSGVAAAYTLDDILNSPVSQDAKRISRGTSAQYAGDVLLEILPGWQILEEESKTAKTNAKLIRANAVNTPAFILAPEIKPEKITSIVDATFLAPTVARILRIRSPNAASHKPLSL